MSKTAPKSPIPIRIPLPSDGPVQISTTLHLPEPFDVADEPLTLRPIAPFVGETSFHPMQVELAKTVNGDAARLLWIHHLDYYFRNQHDLPTKWAEKTKGGETQVIVFSGTPLYVVQHEEPMFPYLKCSNPAMFPKRGKRWIPGLILCRLVEHPQSHIVHALRRA